MTPKQMYIERLADTMRSTGQENWAHNDMADLCELANLWDAWIDTRTRRAEEALALRAAKRLGVEIRHVLPACSGGLPL